MWVGSSVEDVQSVLVKTCPAKGCVWIGGGISSNTANKPTAAREDEMNREKGGNA